MPSLVYKTIDDLKRITDAQMGGVAAILFTPVDNLIGFSVVDHTTKMLSWINIKAGSKFYVANIPDQKRPINEAQQEGDGGSYMQITVAGFLPFESSGNHQDIDVMKYYKYIVLVKTFGGLIKVLGTKDNPVSFSHSYGSGGSSSESSGTDILFSWVSEDKPLLLDSISHIYAGAIPGDVGGGIEIGGGGDEDS